MEKQRIGRAYVKIGKIWQIFTYPCTYVLYANILVRYECTHMQICIDILVYNVG